MTKKAEAAFNADKETILDWLTQEISTLRSSRVKPNIVERLQVESYGALTPLNGLASISNSDARTLLISPWDKNNIAPIEKAVTAANLGVQPVVDGMAIRLSFPSLTQEIREHTLKTLNDKAEEARVKLRVARDEALKSIRAQKEKGEITEDDFYKGKENLDKLIDSANEEVARKVVAKEEEIRTV